MDKSKEGAGSLKTEDDKCSVITVDSGSDEDLDCFITGVSMKKENISCVVIDSGSDDDYLPEKKRLKIHDKSSKDESKKLSGTSKQLTNEPPIVILDDEDDDLENPVVTKDGSCDQGKIVKKKEKKDEFTVTQHKLSSVAGKQNLLKNRRQLPNDRKAKPEILDRELPTNGKPMPVVEQPRKRKYKTKNITVAPAVKERKKRKPSKKKPETVKFEKSKRGNSQCKIPGCFFHGLENLKRYSGKNYKQNKDELIQKIYSLLNSSVFDQKMPEKIDIDWSKKMLRSAGLCTTGKLRYPKRQRYAKIRISLKVCDSADRLRDTLIHEVCHAASWLLDGIRDSHGDMWRYYARKSNMVHPELPKVTRCHNYKINYKIYYECTQCKSRVGRYSRSLDTTRFMCAKCTGSLVLLPLTRKDGTPIQPHVRPFAKYVQENYRKVKKETEGISHGDVMRKLSKDFIAKKQSQGL
ncbi:germ cell nuclear acidic protein isoform X2 [Odocoileus virginianus]|uniref:Acidic repeat-containing protein isoform X2 n=1 Tax=Odocoileus virginianus TaxID=9874 RepID=A0A6J0WL71_ODOVR|nr:acidic repeat-containing protein isoform X2 [Odocoileus virginianus texanus]XP_020738606.1 acidic repeat-containing protein isoform X2 [Odocoileus virginianus texanus]XP_020738607.1 acidic repeat-containing protein isoform X2 [Odocoileus virginianus texanus]